MYLEAGIKTATDFFGRLAFDEEVSDGRHTQTDLAIAVLNMASTDLR